MPFIEILHHGDLPPDVLISVRDTLRRDTAAVIERFDPAHDLTESMIDLRVIEVGQLDSVRPEVLVTILARFEPARDRHKLDIVSSLTGSVQSLLPDTDVMVEFVLTNRVSIYEYPI